MYQGFQYHLFGKTFCFTKSQGWFCYNRLGQVSDYYDSEDDLWKDLRENKLRFSVEPKFKALAPVLSVLSFTG